MRFIALFLFLPISIFGQDLTLEISSLEAPSCGGGNDGIVVLLAEGGVAPYVYSIAGGDEQDSSTFEGLEAGDYDFSVTDADGTIVFVSGTLEDGINLSLNINDIDPSCMEAIDGQLMIAEVNGVSDVTYEISGPVGDSNMTGIFTDLPIGTYLVSASTSSNCIIVISTSLTSNVECPEEDPNLCPLLVNRIGMQINKVAENEYSLRVHYKDEVDVIKYVSYTALYDIIDFHLIQRQMNVSLKPDFNFSSFCADVEAMRNENNVNTDTSQATSSTQYEINIIRDFILNINEGESLKI